MVMCLSYVAVAVARQRLLGPRLAGAACPPEAEAAGVDFNLSSEALVTRPKAQSGIFSASPQMSKKTASATAEMWGASGPYSP